MATHNQATLTTQLIQTLRVDPAQHPRGQAHLSAASGLVRVRQRLYVVADDELHLGIFDEPTAAQAQVASDSNPEHPIGSLLRLLEGSLPQN